MAFKILHCIHSVDPAGGGPIEAVKQLSAVHNRRGHEVEIVSLDEPEASWVEECPFKVHAMGPDWLSYGYSARLTPWLRAHVRTFDVVVINGLWQYHSFGAWRALRNVSMPYFVFTHGMLDPWFKRTYMLKHLKKSLYWPWAEYRVLRDASAVLFTCEEERRLARQSFSPYRANERVVKIGTLGPSRLSSPDSHRMFAKRWPATLGKRCILHFGRVHEKKGTDLLLSAFAQFRRELPRDEAAEWHLIIGGPADHAYGRAMQALVGTLGLNSCVTWTGMLTGDAKWAAFHQAEVLSLPSHQENFGIVVVEALACGKPVLISDKVNIWREIDAADAAFVDTDDIDGTLRLLRRWRALSPEERERMGERALACFKSEFDIEKCAENFISVVSEFTAKP